MYMNIITLPRYLLGPISAVYLLVDEDEIVYIGQSKNIWSRLSKHSDDKIMAFEDAIIIPCPKEGRKKLEMLLIKIFKPKYNSGEVRKGLWV